MENANQILFRCSGLSNLMTEARSKSETISETTKTHLIEVFVSNKYNRFSEISAKQLDKGNDTEEDSITTVSRITGIFFKKNEERISNEFIMGTPDLFNGEIILKADKIRDTKSSWNAHTFFKAKNKGLLPCYYWQGMGYMDLTNAKECSIDYCLNNTPFYLVQAELRKESYNHEGDTPDWIELQIIANHVYDLKTFKEYIDQIGINPSDSNSIAIIKGFVEIPLKERHFNFEFKRDENAIEKIHQKVIDCREYMNENFFNI